MFSVLLSQNVDADAPWWSSTAADLCTVHISWHCVIFVCRSAIYVINPKSSLTFSLRGIAVVHM